MLDVDAAVPAPGERITSGDREVGRVTSSTWSATLARPVALGYVHRDFVAAGTRVAIAAARAEVVSLPFIPRAQAS